MWKKLKQKISKKECSECAVWQDLYDDLEDLYLKLNDEYTKSKPTKKAKAKKTTSKKSRKNRRTTKCRIK